MKGLQGLHLHFDPQSGIAGDMTVAALVDAGVPARVVSDAVAAMGVRGLKVKFERRKRGTFAGRGFVVDWPGRGHADDHDHDHHHDHDHDHSLLLTSHDHDHDHDGDHHHGDHRDYAEIRRLLRRARLGSDVRHLAGDIFDRIARAEAALHGTTIDRVAFHEVGAFDSIADVVGAAAAIAWLAPSAVTSAAPVLGTGTVRTAHGRVAVPAPATAALLQGVPVRAEGQGELTTPTGAAILAAVVGEYRPLPPVRLRAQGFGAGSRELPDRPNVLRVLLGEPVGQALAPSAPAVTLLQANIDDMSPQLVDPLIEALFAAGAVDAWVTPIQMKKGRPAIEVSALAANEQIAQVTDAFFRHSTTLGVRRAPFERAVLERSRAEVPTPWGRVAVKVAARDGEVLGASPEYDDCRALARRANVPVRRVLATAAAAAYRIVDGARGKR